MRRIITWYKLYFSNSDIEFWIFQLHRKRRQFIERIQKQQVMTHRCATFRRPVESAAPVVWTSAWNGSVPTSLCFDPYRIRSPGSVGCRVTRVIISLADSSSQEMVRMKAACEQASHRTRNKRTQADTESDRAVVDAGARSDRAVVDAGARSDRAVDEAQPRSDFWSSSIGLLSSACSLLTRRLILRVWLKAPNYAVYRQVMWTWINRK